MEKKSLPIGIQEFKDFKEFNYLYIDKTEYIHRIVTSGQYYFLSRPRRFGKSLLLSTMKELFKGSKELFEGLWIADNWDWAKTNPVLHISFAGSGHQEIGLNDALGELLDFQAAEQNIVLTAKSNATRFKELLEKIHAQHGKVVVLIDEYDKPIIDNIDNVAEAGKNRDILRDFYIVLKDNPQYLRFVFITGVSKFSKVSIFSALNHLDDISTNDAYSTLVGYTQKELEFYFKDFIPVAAKKNEISRKMLLMELKNWYDGYSWDAKNFVYNPFSVLKFFSQNKFDNFWFVTGTPTFLSVLARQQKFYDFEELETEQSAFDTFDVENLNTQAAMFQTGYLTIKKYDRKRQRYTLSYPNQEVRKSFLAFLLEAYSFVQVNNVSPWAIKLEKALFSKDIPMVIDLVNSMFADIPSHIFDGKSEKYYHSLMHLILQYLGTNIESEVNTNKGRIDTVLKTPQYIYILEFKFDKSAHEALADIYTRGYVQKYAHLGKAIIGVGINFSSIVKGIDDWKEEVLG